MCFILRKKKKKNTTCVTTFFDASWRMVRDSAATLLHFSENDRTFRHVRRKDVAPVCVRLTKILIILITKFW